MAQLLESLVMFAHWISVVESESLILMVILLASLLRSDTGP